MKRVIAGKRRGAAALAAAVLCIGMAAVCPARIAQAEEAAGYYDEAGNWIPQTDEAGWENGDSGADALAPADSPDGGNAADDAGSSDFSAEQETSPEARTGSYTVGEDWAADEYASTQETSVYKKDGRLGEENTSTITCSYIDTNYSVLEYEQLRDMLTNNLIYSNVNAQISASAVYTNAKDCLYILTADDASQDYLEVYYYVVGDYRCFCVTVKEYRAEAEEARAQEAATPQEAGKSIAEGFVWN